MADGLNRDWRDTGGEYGKRTVPLPKGMSVSGVRVRIVFFVLSMKEG